MANLSVWSIKWWVMAAVICGCLSSCKKTPPWEVYKGQYTTLDLYQDRFAKEIANFHRQDLDSLPSPGGVVFTGSSSIRLWETLQKDMGEIPSVNRGFGGSTIPEVTQYLTQTVLPYRPQIIVLYAGENDIANDFIPMEAPVGAFVRFAETVHVKLPETRIVYLSMKPSPLRWMFWEKFKEANRLIEDYCQTQDYIEYLDISEVMLAEDGEPDPGIFVSDSLHMNGEGYKRWTSVVYPYLKERWNKAP